MSKEIVEVKGVKISDLEEATTAGNLDYLIINQDGETKKIQRGKVKAQKISELTDDVGYLTQIPGEYMTESEVKELTDAEIAQIRELTNAEIAQIREVLNTWTSFKNSGGEINGGIQAHALKNIYTLTSGEKERCYYFGSLNNFDATIGMEILDKKSGFDTKVELAQGGNPTSGGQGYFGSSHDLITNLGSDNKRWKDVYVGNYSKGEAGYSKLPNGLMIQWFGVDIEVSPGKDALKTCTLPISLGVNSFVISKSTELSCRIVSGWGHDEYIEYISATSYIQLDGVEKSTVNIKLSDVASRLPETTKFKVKFSLIYYDK